MPEPVSDLTEQEVEWMKLLVESTTDTRMALLEGKTPDTKALFDLINRAEALLWHLQKRDKLQPAWVDAMLDAREHGR